MSFQLNRIATDRRTYGSAPPIMVVGLRPTFQLNRVGVNLQPNNKRVVGLAPTTQSNRPQLTDVQ